MLPFPRFERDPFDPSYLQPGYAVRMLVSGLQDLEVEAYGRRLAWREFYENYDPDDE